MRILNSNTLKLGAQVVSPRRHHAVQFSQSRQMSFWRQSLHGALQGTYIDIGRRNRYFDKATKSLRINLSYLVFELWVFEPLSDFRACSIGMRASVTAVEGDWRTAGGTISVADIVYSRAETAPEAAARLWLQDRLHQSDGVLVRPKHRTILGEYTAQGAGITLCRDILIMGKSNSHHPVAKLIDGGNAMIRYVCPFLETQSLYNCNK